MAPRRMGAGGYARGVDRSPDPQELAERRERMLRRDLAGRGITDQRVLDAMAAVAREDFVPRARMAQAYDDRALPIGEGQTISQPFIVALMLQALDLRARDRVLEVGAGSGYASAVASRLCASVLAIERMPALAVAAAARLRRLGTERVRVICADGSAGWAPAAPYDAIFVSAGAPAVPDALIDQLADGGRLVIPVGVDRGGQRLLRLQRRGGEVTTDDLGAVAFVPLVGHQGWAG